MIRSLGYSFKQAFIQFFRNIGMTLASLLSITAMLFILGLFFFLSVNVSYLTESIKSQFDTIEVYLLDDTTSDQAKVMVDSLTAMDEVAGVELITKDMAMEEFKERWGENAYLLDGLSENPLPNSLRVTLTDLEGGDMTAAICRSFTGVEDVRYYKSEIDRMMGAAMTDDQLDDALGNDFIVGEKVKVTFGPFNGFTGEIEEVNREKRKLKVAVKVFGRKTPLELETSQVERE